MSEFRDPRFGLDARLRASTALTLVALAWPGFAYAGPRGGQIVAGDAAISRQGAVTTIQQRSQNAIGNFQSFDVGAQETVNVTQPSTRSNFLARVTGGGGASAIDGQVNATGNLWVVNPNGVLIGETASINAGGFVATSADIDNDAFMSGGRDFNISGAADAVVENRGRITFGESGLAGLVGPNAANAGAIVGQKGRVIVAGAETFAIDMAGDGILALQAGDGAVLSASTTGTIQNAGGQVIIEAATAEAVLESHIHAGGVIEATGFDVAGGQILLSGETVEVTGRLDARAVSTDAAASSAAPTGGEITVTGGGVLIASGAELDASGDGGGGTIRIGGDARGGGDLRRARLTRVDEGASLKVDANSAGDGGDIVVWGDNWTGFAGTASARGGAAGGNGGFVEISGGTLNFDEQLASVDVSAPMGTPGQLLFDPAVIYITSARLYGDVGGYDPLGPPGSDIMYGDAAQYSGITHVSPEFITTFDGDLLLEATDQINIDETVDNFDSTTVTTNLTLRSGANIDFDADLRVSGTLTLESGANFATGPTVSSFGISIGSTVTVQSGGVLSVTLGDGQSLNLYDGSNLISGGALSLPDVALYNSARVAAFGTISQQTGTAILESYTEGNNVGTLTASSSSGDVLLTNSGNGFSAIDVTAENISIAHSESASTNSGLTVLGLTAASSSIGYATISTDGPLDLTQSVTVGGPLTLTGAGISIPTNLTLSGGNLVFDTLSGVLDLETGVRLVSGSTLELPDTRFTGTLTVATAGLTQAAGTTIREGSAAATLVADTGDGDIVLTETGNDVSVIDLSGTNISLAQTSIDSASIGLTITGLDATGTADVTSGDVLVLASDATATGAASFTGAGITVSGNTITGSSLSFNPGSDVLTLNDGTVLSSTASLDLPETRFVGTLTISSGGLTQTGGTALIESSTGSTLVADTGTGDIVLATATNAISNIDLSGDDITLSQTTAAVGVNALGVAGLDATGDATLSTDGVLRFDSNATVTGAASFSGTEILIPGTTVAAGSLTLLTSANTLILEDAAVVTSGSGLVLPETEIQGTVTINSGGDLTQRTGTSVADRQIEGRYAGTLVANAGTGDIVLDSSSNGFSAINATGANVTVVQSTSSSASDGLTLLGLSATGNTSLTSDGLLTISSDVNVPGAASLSGDEIAVQGVSIYGGTLALTTSSNTMFLSDGSSVTSGGALALPETEIYGTVTVSSSGDLTQQTGTSVSDGPSQSRVAATLVADAGTGDVVLANSGNGFSAIDATGANITIAQEIGYSASSGLTLTGLSATGNASVTTDGQLSLTGDVSVPGAASFTGDSINVPGVTVSGGTLTFTTTGRTLLLRDGTALISGSTLELPETELFGAVSVTSSGNLTQATGTAITDGLIEGRTASTLTADAGTGDIVLANSGNGFSAFSGNGANITVNQAIANSASSGLTLLGLTATGNGAVTTDGLLTIAADANVTGTASFTGAGVTVSGVSVSGGVLAIDPGTGVLTLADGSALISGAAFALPNTVLSGSSSVTAVGLTQATGTTVTETGGAATLTAAAGTGDLVFANTGNALSALGASGANVTIGIDSSLSTAGSLTLTGVTATGDLDADVTGPVILGGDVSVTGAASLQSSGAISRAGAQTVSVGGTAEILAFDDQGDTDPSNDVFFDIDLAGANTLSGAVTAIGEDVVIGDAGALIIQDSFASSSFTARSGTGDLVVERLSTGAPDSTGTIATGGTVVLQSESGAITGSDIFATTLTTGGATQGTGFAALQSNLTLSSFSVSSLNLGTVSGDVSLTDAEIGTFSAGAANNFTLTRIAAGDLDFTVNTGGLLSLSGVQGGALTGTVPALSLGFASFDSIDVSVAGAIQKLPDAQLDDGQSATVTVTAPNPSNGPTLADRSFSTGATFTNLISVTGTTTFNGTGNANAGDILLPHGEAVSGAFHNDFNGITIGDAGNVVIEDANALTATITGTNAAIGDVVLRANSDAAGSDGALAAQITAGGTATLLTDGAITADVSATAVQVQGASAVVTSSGDLSVINSRIGGNLSVGITGAVGTAQADVLDTTVGGDLTVASSGGTGAAVLAPGVNVNVERVTIGGDLDATAQDSAGFSDVQITEDATIRADTVVVERMAVGGNLVILDEDGVSNASVATLTDLSVLGAATVNAETQTALRMQIGGVASFSGATSIDIVDAIFSAATTLNAPVISLDDATVAGLLTIAPGATAGLSDLQASALTADDTGALQFDRVSLTGALSVDGSQSLTANDLNVGGAATFDLTGDLALTRSNVTGTAQILGADDIALNDAVFSALTATATSAITGTGISASGAVTATGATIAWNDLVAGTTQLTAGQITLDRFATGDMTLSAPGGVLTLSNGATGVLTATDAATLDLTNVQTGGAVLTTTNDMRLSGIQTDADADLTSVNGDVLIGERTIVGTLNTSAGGVVDNVTEADDVFFATGFADVTVAGTEALNSPGGVDGLNDITGAGSGISVVIGQDVTAALGDSVAAGRVTETVAPADGASGPDGADGLALAIQADAVALTAPIPDEVIENIVQDIIEDLPIGEIVPDEPLEEENSLTLPFFVVTDPVFALPEVDFGALFSASGNEALWQRGSGSGDNEGAEQ